MDVGRFLLTFLKHCMKNPKKSCIRTAGITDKTLLVPELMNFDKTKYPNKTQLTKNDRIR